MIITYLLLVKPLRQHSFNFRLTEQTFYYDEQDYQSWVTFKPPEVLTAINPLCLNSRENDTRVGIDLSRDDQEIFRGLYIMSVGRMR